MGFIDLLLFVVATSLGILSLAKVGEVGPAGVTFWVVGAAVFYFPLALCVIVLAREHPGKEGGLYLWSKSAFGDFAGFMTGWSYWLCILPFLPGVLYFAAGSALFIDGPRWQHLAKEPAYFVAASLVFLALATALNLLGLRVGKWLHNAGAVGTWVPALALVVLALLAWAGHGPATPLTAARFVPAFGLREAVVWSVMVMSLTGLEAAAMLGGEIRNSRRLPLALTVAAVLVIVTKVLGTLAVLAAIPSEELGGSGSFMQAVERVSARAGAGGWLLPAVALLVVVGHVGKVGAWSATGARMPMAAGLDSTLPGAFARVHPRWGSPYVALLFQAAVVAVLVVVGQAGTSTKGAYDVFLSMTLIPTFVPFLFVFAAAIKAVWEDKTRAWRRGKIVMLALGLATTAASTALAVAPPPDEPNQALYVAKVVGLAAVMLGAGALLYLAGKRRGHAAAAARLARAGEPPP
jgi:amino acid transporter